MLKPVTIAIAVGALGFIVGTFIPAAVAYSILYVRRNGRHFRVYVKAIGAPLAAVGLAGLMGGYYMGVPELLGYSDAAHLSDLPHAFFAYGNGLGCWVAIVALYMGFRRARKSSSAAKR